MFLYYPSRRQMPPKLRAFIDHVKSRQSVDQTANDGDDHPKPRGKAAR
jgi:hypothetical protein